MRVRTVPGLIVDGVGGAWLDDGVGAGWDGLRGKGFVLFGANAFDCETFGDSGGVWYALALGVCAVLCPAPPLGMGFISPDAPQSAGKLLCGAVTGGSLSRGAGAVSGLRDAAVASSPAFACWSCAVCGGVSGVAGCGDGGERVGSVEVC